MQAVLDGQGIGLMDKQFTAPHIKAGRLLHLFDIPFKFGSYWLVARDFSALPPASAHFADWIRKCHRGC